MKLYFTRLVNKLKYILKQAGFVVSLFCFLLFTNCSDDNPIVASVDDVELSKEDATMLMKHLGYDIKNPKEWKRFIHFWCEQQVFNEELNLTDVTKSRLVNLRSQVFAGDLAKYYLEEKLISQKLDTVISEKELKKYYDANKEAFELQDYIVKALYIKVPKEAKTIEKFKKHYLLKNDKDLAQVNSNAKLYADDYYFNDENWIYFSELTKEVPLKNYNIDNIVLNRTKTYFSDDQFVYFLNIIDFNLKNETPPFDFFKDQLKEMIIAQRMNTLRERNESKMIQEIKTKHEIKINI
jgi:hypothetical protein